MSNEIIQFIRSMFSLCWTPFTWVIPGFTITIGQLFFGIIGTTVAVSIALKLLFTSTSFAPRN